MSSVEDGQIGIDPSIANVSYERMIFEDERRGNQNPYWKQHKHLFVVLQQKKHKKKKRMEKKENDDSVTITAANESGGGLDDDKDNDGNENENKDESKTDEHERNDENELSGDVLLKDILSKFSFDGGVVCVISPIKLPSLERLKIVKFAAGNTHSMCG